jgi:hypothetical protein
MDDKIRNQAAGRDESAADAGHGTVAAGSSARTTDTRDLPNEGTAPATRPTEPTATSAGVRVRLCKWCKQIDLRGARRQTDVIAILIIGEIVRACWNGKDMIVQDGICESCAAALKSGRVVDGSTML